MVKWLNKIDLLILLTIIATMMFAVLMLYGFNNNKFDFFKNTDKGQITTQETKINRTDYTDVARKTLDWIDKQRNKDGWYILERGCDYDKKTCDTVWDNKEGNKDGLITTWARLNFYEQHKDPKDLEIVKKDIDIFYDKYKDDNLKDSLWICKISYEMAQSEYIDQTQKDKLEEICFDARFLEIKTVNDFEMNNQLFDGISEKLKSWDSWSNYVFNLRGVNVSYGLASDLVARYRWKGIKSDLDLAKKSIILAEQYVSDIRKTNNKYLTARDICLLGNSVLDVYEFGDKSETDLNFVKDIFISYMNNEKDKRKYQNVFCGLLTKKLYLLNKDTIFLNRLENNNKFLTKNLYDDKDSFALITESGGFFRTFFGRLRMLFKDVGENGLIVELMRD